jgi:misacylated tRNA(Ala) deacylase
MTEALFRQNAYLREAEARVVSAGPEGIVLDATVFYARGGGQPGDHGKLRLADGAAIEIVDAVYDADRKTILHVPAAGCPRSANASSPRSTGNCATAGCVRTPRCIFSPWSCPTL